MIKKLRLKLFPSHIGICFGYLLIDLKETKADLGVRCAIHNPFSSIHDSHPILDNPDPPRVPLGVNAKSLSRGIGSIKYQIISLHLINKHNI